MPATTAAKKTAASKPPPPPDQPDAAPASAGQLRHLHALLRDHGITGDQAKHDYLTVAVGRGIESTTWLTTVECAEVIRELETAEVAEAAPGPSKAALRKLRAPFAEEAVGKLPRSLCSNCSAKDRGPGPGVCDLHPQKGKCGVCGNYHNTQATMHIDFVGHADVTARLLEVDPEWTWRPFTTEDLNGIPPEFRKGLWIWLTVLGVERPGYGDAEGGKGAKEAIGDALRNAAMRFGVALDLWAKGDREWAHTEKHGTDQHPDSAPPRQSQADPTPTQAWNPSTEDCLTQISDAAARLDMTVAEVTAKWRQINGNMPVEDLQFVPAEQLVPLVQAILAEEKRRATPVAP